MYQAHIVSFATAVPKVCPAYVHRGGEIYSIDMLGAWVFRLCIGGMGSGHFAEIVEDQPGIDFLEDELLLPAVEVNKPHCVLQLTEACFYGLYESSYNP